MTDRTAKEAAHPNKGNINQSGEGGQNHNIAHTNFLRAFMFQCMLTKKAGRCKALAPKQSHIVPGYP